MFDRERKLYAFNLAMAQRLVADVSDDQFNAQPCAGMNPPRWILGHLAVTSDGAAARFGATRTLPAAWHAAFVAGTPSVDPNAPQPSKAQLLDALTAAHDRLLAALDAIADPSLFDQPHGIKFESVETFFPARGDLVAFLMGDHEAFHVGQLSAWRRALGRPPLF